MCNTFAIYFQIFVTFGYKKVKNSDTKWQQYRQMAQTDIRFLLEGKTHRLIDEWQEKLIDDGAKTLIALSNIIDTTKMKAPAFCMVLTGVGDFAYKRTDGVYVVPLGCLGP